MRFVVVLVVASQLALATPLEPGNWPASLQPIEVTYNPCGIDVRTASLSRDVDVVLSADELRIGQTFFTRVPGTETFRADLQWVPGSHEGPAWTGEGALVATLRDTGLIPRLDLEATLDFAPDCPLDWRTSVVPIVPAELKELLGPKTPKSCTD